MLDRLFGVQVGGLWATAQALLIALIIWGVGYAYFTTVGDNKEEDGND